MDLAHLSAFFAGRHDQALVTVDSHTAGEPTRLVVGGLPPVPGSTMAEKRAHFMKHLDHVRLLLTREPRGHRDMLAAVVTEPCTPGADFGLIYMDARRYPFLCGHATIGAVTTLIECGVISAKGSRVRVIVDTPSGPMPAQAALEGGRVVSVSYHSVPSFVAARDKPLEVEGLGRIPVDLVCVGGYFAMVDAVNTGLELVPENSHELVRLGMRIVSSANRQFQVTHPLRPEVGSIDVAEIHASRGSEGINAVVYGESHLDRSPCGTGTTAKLALLHARGQLDPEELFVNRSMLGQAFTGRIVAVTRVGDYRAVVAEISGSAHMTGLHRFFRDPDDPYPHGFLL